MSESSAYTANYSHIMTPDCKESGTVGAFKNWQLMYFLIHNFCSEFCLMRHGLLSVPSSSLSSRQPLCHLKHVGLAYKQKAL